MHFGYIQPPADHHLLLRSHRVEGSIHPLPSEAWLSGWFPGVRNQLSAGSCTGFGTAGFREVLHGSATKHRLGLRLSPAYLWGRTRQAEGTFPKDAGCTVADEMAVLHSRGVCRESVLPYRADPFEGPTPFSDEDAQHWRIGPPMSVAPTRRAISTCLAAGLPVVVGMPVGHSFLDVGTDGKVPMPPAGEASVGGHCVFLLGYNEWAMMIANSWGSGWGDHGFAYLPWGYESRFWEAWTAPAVS